MHTHTYKHLYADLAKKKTLGIWIHHRSVLLSCRNLLLLSLVWLSYLGIKYKFRRRLTPLLLQLCSSEMASITTRITGAAPETPTSIICEHSP